MYLRVEREIFIFEILVGFYYKVFLSVKFRKVINKILFFYFILMKDIKSIYRENNEIL